MESDQNKGRKTATYPTRGQNHSSTDSSLVSSYSNSANSKTVGSGFNRRPSENLLMNMAGTDSSKALEPSIREQIEDDSDVLNFKPPNRKNVLAKHERPISNDSINTNGDVFSFDGASSKDSSRGTSIIDDVDQQGGLNTKPKKETFEESYLTDKTFSDAGVSIKTVNTNKTSDPPSTTYVFSNNVNGALAQTSHSTTQTNDQNSMRAIRGDSSSKSTKAMNLSVHSKSVPSLPQESNLKSLTPSQRYRLRREQNKIHLQNSIKQKESYYDEMSKSEDIFDERLITNIPMATNGSVFYSQRKPRASLPNLSKPVETLDSTNMPPSPIPGLQRVSDFEYLTQVGKDLNKVYQQSENRLSKTKLMERTRSAETLPMGFKNASDEGMEDLKLVSEDKITLISSTRPSWLPPKDEEEKKCHDRAVRKTLSIASIDKLESSSRRYEQETRDETNKQKLILLIDRGLTRKSSLRDLRKIAWETGISSNQRFTVFNTLLDSEYNIISTKYIDPCDNLEKIIRSKMTPFPKNQQMEIEQLLDTMHVEVSSDIRKNLIKLLQWKSISKLGLQTGDHYLMYHLLIDGFDIKQTWKTVNLIQLTCFSDSVREKFDARIISKNGVVAKFLRGDSSFENEFNQSLLNYSTSWNCFARLDHEHFMWVLDTIVSENSRSTQFSSNWEALLANTNWDSFKEKYVTTNYKILCSMVLTILLNYHFGWNDFIQLDQLPSSFKILCSSDDSEPVRNQQYNFMKKWAYYYRKF